MRCMLPAKACQLMLLADFNPVPGFRLTLARITGCIRLHLVTWHFVFDTTFVPLHVLLLSCASDSAVSSLVCFSFGPLRKSSILCFGSYLCMLVLLHTLWTCMLRLQIWSTLWRCLIHLFSLLFWFVAWLGLGVGACPYFKVAWLGVWLADHSFLELLERLCIVGVPGGTSWCICCRSCRLAADWPIISILVFGMLIHFVSLVDSFCFILGMSGIVRSPLVQSVFRFFGMGVPFDSVHLLALQLPGV